jgi:hypothetical protein
MVQEASAQGVVASRFGPVVAVSLGCVLTAAACLKVVNPSPPGLDNVTAGQVLAEVVLGAWLVSGVSPAAARAVGITCFGLFAGVATFYALDGRESCGCLGAVAIEPWVMAGFDVGAVLLLAVTRSGSRPSGVRIVFGVGVALAGTGSS